MDAEKKRLRDEVAELSEAVRMLRDELAATRMAHQCCHHVHYTYTPTPWYPNTTYPYVVTCGSGGGISTATIPGTVTTTNTYALT